MAETKPPQQPNTVGNASLALGIISAALVFGIGLCALSGVGQGWIRLAGTPLWVCGASSAFLGFLAVILGAAGSIGKNRSRATSIAGFVLGLLGSCLFIIFLNLVARGG